MGVVTEDAVNDDNCMLLVKSVLTAEEEAAREDTFTTFRMTVEPTREERSKELTLKVDPVNEEIPSWGAVIDDATNDDTDTLLVAIMVLAIKEDIPNCAM